MTSIPDNVTLIDSDVVRVHQESPGYLRAVLDNPPLNLVDGAVFAGLRLLREYTQANDVAVIVFESADPDFFVSHLDFKHITERPDVAGAGDFIAEWPDFSHWLSTGPAVTIVKVRGITRGIGNELACACDMRFASPRARFAQHEIGYALVPGGGGLEWLPRLVGRSRALEVVLSGEDFDGELAAEYGWVNRCLDDDRLDAHVDLLARRIAGFDRDAVRTAKEIVARRAGTVSVADLQESFAAINHLGQQPASRDVYARMGATADTRAAQRSLPALLGPTVV